MLADDVAWALPLLRTEAEALMVDTCTITRAGEGQGPWNPGTKEYDTPPGTTIYSGRCKVQTRNVAVAEPEVAEQEIGVLSWEVHLPVAGSEGVARGDTVTVTSAAFDAALVGQEFTVMGPFVGSVKTARRLPVKAVV